MNNIPRYLILVALAVVGYLLLNAWRNDYVQPTPSTTASTLKQSESTDPDSADQPANLSTSSAELPQTASQAAPLVAAEKSTRNGLIEVKSDLFTLKIDLIGGDIVAAALNQYPAHIETPNAPFSLLDRNGRVYVAQSGLIGPNGPDADPDGRPHYSTTSNSYQLVKKSWR